jgi:hypothetical protein
MELFQFAGEGVGVCRCETIGGRSSTTPHLPKVWVSQSSTLRDKSSNNIQHVPRPAALGDGNIFQRFDALEFFPDLFRRDDDRVRSAGVRAGGFMERLAPFIFTRRDAARTRSRDGRATLPRHRSHHFNPRLNRDAIQSEVTTDPSGASGGGPEWRTVDDGGGREGGMRGILTTDERRFLFYLSLRPSE